MELGLRGGFPLGAVVGSQPPTAKSCWGGDASRPASLDDPRVGARCGCRSGPIDPATGLPSRLEPEEAARRLDLPLARWVRQAVGAAA